MEFQSRLQVGQKGTVVIPAAIRHALGIEVGDSVEMRVQNYELPISTRRSRIRRAQQRVRKLVPPGTLLSEELNAERREAAKQECDKLPEVDG